jgi:phage terminase large subunit-like protein
MKCDSATVWIPDEYILKATKKLDINDFNFIGEDCYIGIDLSSNVDLTAVCYLFVKDNIYYFYLNYYLPTDTLEVRNLHADKELYKEWFRHKYLKTTPGNITDYDYVTKDILDIDKQSEIKKIYYDRYNATAFANQCIEAGLPMEPFSQTIGNFNSCTKSFERLMLGGLVVIDDNPINRYCLRNVELRYDVNRNCKPLRMNEKKKIDGVIAMLQALAAYEMANATYQGTNIY